MVRHTFRTPHNILPPATPPLSSSTSQPGLFTSKDLITTQQTINQHYFKSGLLSAPQEVSATYIHPKISDI